MSYIGHFNLVWAERDLYQRVELATDDSFTVSIKSAEAQFVILHPSLQVETVVSIGSKVFKYEISAKRYLTLPIGAMLFVDEFDPEFHEYREDLVTFLSYRQQILDGLSSPGVLPPAP